MCLSVHYVVLIETAVGETQRKEGHVNSMSEKSGDEMCG